MSLIVKQIGKEYNDEMLEILLDSPMVSSGLSLCLDRSPDMFVVPELFYQSYKAYGFFRDDELVGFGMIGQKELYVNGFPKRVGYFMNLYVKKEARKLGWLYRAAEPMFGEMAQKTDLGFATTVQGNRATEKMIGRRISKFPMMPFSASIGLQVIENILITFYKRPKTLNLRPKTEDLRPKLEIRKGKTEDLSRIAWMLNEEYRGRLFGPVLDEERLVKLIETRPGFEVSDYWIAERDGQMVGVCSAWDISSFRRVRVMEYRKRFKWVYWLYKITRPIMRFPGLPKPGEPFRELIVNDFAVENRDPKILEVLLRAIYREAHRKRYNMIQIGSYSGDPILKAVRPFFAMSVYNHVVMGSTSEDLIKEGRINTTRPYVDIALN